MGWWQRRFIRRSVDLDEEIHAHLQMAARDRVGRGESREQAHAAAVREFGNVPLVKDVDAEMSDWIWLGRLLGDMRYAVRQLRNSPGFSVTAILTLALAIGATTAVFTLVHAILLRQLPFDDPSRVFSAENVVSVGLGYDMRSGNFAASFNDAARSFKTIAGAAMYWSGDVNADLGAGSARRLRAAETSAQFLHVLGVTPILGRGFTSGEDTPGKDLAILISNRLWRGAFHADTAVLGKTVKINGFDFTIAGVLPPQMDFPANTDLWAPTIFDEHKALHEAGAFITAVILRAREKVSADAVRAEFNARIAHIRQQHGEKGNASEDEKPILTPIAAELTQSIRSSLLMLAVAVSFVLLIACANIASLSLVRIAERRGELAVRAALGAGRGRLIQQQLVEATLMALAAGVLGVFVAYSALRALYLFRPAALGPFQRPVIDPVVLAFAAGIALATGLVFGIAPAWLAAREDPAGALRSGLWRTSACGARLRKMLVAGEMGVAFVLLIGAGLLLRTLENLNQVPLGYEVKEILSFSISLHGEPYLSQESGSQALSIFYSNVLERLAGIPGVASAAAVSTLPLDTRADMLLPVNAENANQKAEAAPRFSSSGYFGVMGIPILAGRDFSEHDSRTGPKVVIVTSDLAQKLWPGQNPLGRRLGCLWFCKESPSVIGVVPPSRRFGPRDRAIPEYYMPYTQQDWPYMTFVLRTRSDPAVIVHSARRAVAAVDPAQPIYNIKTMQQRLDDNESLVRFELFALSVFAILAVLLVSIGLYGVISYTVTQRTREIGLRIALGARRITILAAIVRESAWIALAGTMIGLVSSVALTRLLNAVLFGVTPHDPHILVAVFLLFMAIAMMAGYIPAHRAASVDPAHALRLE